MSVFSATTDAANVQRANTWNIFYWDSSPSLFVNLNDSWIAEVITYGFTLTYKFNMFEGEERGIWGGILALLPISKMDVEKPYQISGTHFPNL